MTLVADLMETTGKPIINVPDTSHPRLDVRLRAAVQPDRARHPAGGGAGARSHGMVWCLPAAATDHNPLA